MMMCIQRCGNFAVRARTTITFDGVMSMVHGDDVGVSTGNSTTGSYSFDEEGPKTGQVVLDSSVFADSVLTAHAEAMEEPSAPMAIEIEGLPFTPGTYHSGSAINFVYGTVVTLDGQNQANPVFLFQAGSTLVTAANTYFILKNGAKVENAFWALGTAATLGANNAEVQHTRHLLLSFSRIVDVVSTLPRHATMSPYSIQVQTASRSQLTVSNASNSKRVYLLSDSSSKH
jgi:hypothetical protein